MTVDCVVVCAGFILAAPVHAGHKGPGMKAAPGELPAFHGAEGFGATTPGGRGGRVIKVTNLKPGGPGSLQAACEAEGPRIVVFEVSGVVEGDIVIRHSHITIAGQTAPGAGITIRGMLATQYPKPISDVVVRFLRVRPPPSKKKWAGGDAIQMSVADRVILDHVSCSWASDETVDIYGATNVTVQWCTIEESDITGHTEGRHNYGLICGPGKRVSIHHTLFAHHARRCPAIRNGPADVRNIVVYNFRDGLSHEGGGSDTGYNLIGNYYKRGPSDPKIFPFCFSGEISYYLRDNYVEGIGMIQDPWAEQAKLLGFRYYGKKGKRARKEFEVPEVTTHMPQEAYRLVLGKAGCFPRDVVSKRIIEETRRGTGSWGRHEPKDLMEGLTPAPPPRDSDGDGMPDGWERKRRLDPARDDHNVRMRSGYTAVEEYLNELASALIGGAGRQYQDHSARSFDSLNDPEALDGGTGSRARTSVGEEKRREKEKVKPRIRRPPPASKVPVQAEKPQGPSESERLLKRAETLFIDGELDRAREIFRRVVEENPDTPSAERAREYLEILN